MEKIVNAILGVRTLETASSPINGKLTVVRDLSWGTHIKAGGLTQSGGVAYSVWHTSLSKVNSLGIRVNKCLILGLGGGSIAKIVRSFWKKSKIVGVDIDPIIVEMGKKHMGLDKLKVDVVIGDAFVFCKKERKSKKAYELICVDMYQGSEIPEVFDTLEFAKLLEGLISQNGVIVFNRLYFGEKRTKALKFLKNLEKVFPTIHTVYPEANVMFLCRK